MKRQALWLRLVLLTTLLFLSASAQAQIEITLKNSFVDKYRNRVTIDATYTVDKAHKKVNPPSKDGDMHIAGRAPEIGLPTVAEIMNAASTTDAVGLIHRLEGTGNTVNITGVWRLWCEHGGTEPQIQGAALQPFDTTNPAHVFEIHPVIRLGTLSLLDTLVPIQGFNYKDAETAFVKYEGIPSQITPGKATTKIVTNMAGFNYVEFVMELLDDQQQVVDDGRMVFASVRSLNDDLLVRKRRMVFVKDSPPEQIVKTLKKGQQLHVVGVPRINLDLVRWRTHNFKTRPGTLRWNLPYEIVVVASLGVVDNE